jgi:hypothetical protein
MLYSFHFILHLSAFVLHPSNITRPGGSATVGALLVPHTRCADRARGAILVVSERVGRESA